MADQRSELGPSGDPQLNPTIGLGSPQTSTPTETALRMLQPDSSLWVRQIKENLKKASQGLVKLRMESILSNQPEQRKQLMDRLQEWKPKNEEVQKEFSASLIFLLSTCCSTFNALQVSPEFDAISAKLELKHLSISCHGDDQDEDLAEEAKDVIDDDMVKEYDSWKSVFKNTVSACETLLCVISSELENRGRMTLGFWLKKNEECYPEIQILSELRRRAIYIGTELSQVLVQLMIYLMGNEDKIQELKLRFLKAVEKFPTTSKVASKFLALMKIAESVISEMSQKDTPTAIKGDEGRSDKLIWLLFESVQYLDWVLCSKVIPEGKNVTGAITRIEIILGHCLYNMMKIKKGINVNKDYQESDVWNSIANDFLEDYSDILTENEVEDEDENGLLDLQIFTMTPPEQCKQFTDKLKEWNTKTEETDKEFSAVLLFLLSPCYTLLESLDRFSKWEWDAICRKLESELRSHPCNDDDKDDDPKEGEIDNSDIQNYYSWKRSFDLTVSACKASLSGIIYELEEGGRCKQTLELWLKNTEFFYLPSEFKLLKLLRSGAIYIAIELSQVLVHLIIHMIEKEGKIQELKSKLMRVVKKSSNKGMVANKFLAVMEMAERILSEMKSKDTSTTVESEEGDEELSFLISLLFDSVKKLDLVLCWRVVPEKRSNVIQARIRLELFLGQCSYNMMVMKMKVNDKKQSKKIEIWEAVKVVWDDCSDILREKM